MKNLVLVIFAIILLFSCEKVEKLEGEEYFIFGVYNGFCSVDCTALFKLEDQRLLADDIDVYFADTELKFEEEGLEAEKYDLANEVFEQLPSELLETSEKSFGCPGCVDQDIILLIYFDGSEKMEWQVDTDVDQLPDYLQGYAQEIQDLVEELQD